LRCVLVPSSLTIATICFCYRTGTAIPSPVRFRRVAAAADRQAITNLAADRPLTRKRVQDHCLVRRVATAASTRAVLDIRTPDRAQGPVRIQVIAGAVIAAIHEVPVQDAADM